MLHDGHAVVQHQWALHGVPGTSAGGGARVPGTVPVHCGGVLSEAGAAGHVRIGQEDGLGPPAVCCQGFRSRCRAVQSEYTSDAMLFSVFRCCVEYVAKL